VLGDSRVQGDRGVLGDSDAQSRSLESVASAVHYHDWLTSLARPWLGDHPLELGGGLGDYARRWLSSGVPKITVIERDAARLDVLRRSFAGDARVSVLDLDVLDPKAVAGEASYSSYVAFNVLEHIPDDVEALRAAHRLVRPGGRVIMLVPAFQFAMSEFDRTVGHVRRYTKRSLGRAYRDAGLDLELLHYVNAPGLPAWFVGMRLLRMTPGEGPLLRIWDSTIVPCARAVERRLRPPFGQSVFAVGMVPGRTESAPRRSR
jgi:SAM-dependent methyltransferase